MLYTVFITDWELAKRHAKPDNNAILTAGYVHPWGTCGRCLEAVEIVC